MKRVLHKYARLVIVEVLEAISGKYIYKCKCDCGKVVAITEHQAISAKDCGCGVGSEPKIRTEYMFKKTILERDGHRCIRCGSTEELQAHHVNNSREGKDRRLDVNNGVTLCKKCHKLFHSRARYGTINNNITQLYTFVSSYKEENGHEQR